MPSPQQLGLPSLPIATLIIVGFLFNLSCTFFTVREMVTSDTAADWHVLTSVAQVGMAPHLYSTGLYQWSPLLVPVIQALAPLGVGIWRLLHVAGALAMPTWPMRLVVLASWPFWFDLSVGNVLTFVLLTAAWAVRGSTLAGMTYLGLTLLIPGHLCSRSLRGCSGVNRDSEAHSWSWDSYWRSARWLPVTPGLGWPRSRTQRPRRVNGPPAVRDGIST
jgi:hypothetical protein